MRRVHPPLVAAAVLLAGTASALHRESLPVTPVTSGSPHEPTDGLSWGNWLAFASTADLAGLGAARTPGAQIFVFNLAYFDCAQGTTMPTTPCPPPGTPYLVQVTNDVGEPANPSVSRAPSGATGLFDVWVAFDADGSYGGGSGPGASHRQIFVRNVGSSELHRVTDAGDGDSTAPSISEVGGVVTFESTATITSVPNPAGVSQVYAYDRPDLVLHQLSVGPAPANAPGLGPSTSAVPNRTGNAIVFESTADLLGTGADTGVSQIFYAEYDKSTNTSVLHRLTDGNGPSRHPFIGTTPKAVYFDSTATNLPGGATFGRRVYRLDDPPATDVVSMTDPLTMGDCFVPAIDLGGSRLTHVCLGDPLHNGSTGPRLFVRDLDDGALYQITSAGTVVGRPTPSLGQWFVALTTSSDLAGTGACTTQLHVVDYYPDAYVAATTDAQLPADGVDGNVCLGSCSTAGECDDGNPCNGTEVCSAPFCALGSPIVCLDPDPCDGVAVCNPTTGACVSSPPPSCDDGNACTDDVCQAVVGCVSTPNTASCDDGSPCTTADACSAGACRGTPVSCGPCESCDDLTGACFLGPGAGCHGAAGGFRSVLALRDDSDAGSRLVWKWRRSVATPYADFGDPTTTQDYHVCLYDQAGAVRMQATIPAGGFCGTRPCWKAKGTTGFRFKNRLAPPDGITRVVMKSAGSSSVKVVGAGASLSVPPPTSLALPIHLQLRAGTGACWDASFDGSDVSQQSSSLLKAKATQ